MSAFGFTINLLTLLAIVLSVGLVVDDAIVVVENVERHIALGESPFEAAKKAARELLGPIISMTITLAAVYAPIGLQGGLTGVLFREFAFTLAGAVLVSGFVAITLSPMMASRLLRESSVHSGFAGFVNRKFDQLRDRYEVLLDHTVRYRNTTLGVAVIVILLVIPFYLFSGKELAPREDQGFAFAFLQTAPNSTIDQAQLFADKVGETFRSIPEMQNAFQTYTPSFGFAGITFKPFSDESESADIAAAMFGQAAAVPGIRSIVSTPAPLPGASDYPIEFVISSTADPREIYEFADAFVKKAYASGVFMFADTDLKFDLPQTSIIFDRDKVATVGANLSQTGGDLSTMLSGNYVNRFSTQGRSYKVIPQVKRDQRLTIDQVEDYYVTGPNSKIVPLATFATRRRRRSHVR